jgi:hypothetical protein
MSKQFVVEPYIYIVTVSQKPKTRFQPQKLDYFRMLLRQMFRMQHLKEVGISGIFSSPNVPATHISMGRMPQAMQGTLAHRLQSNTYPCIRGNGHEV